MAAKKKTAKRAVRSDVPDLSSTVCYRLHAVADVTIEEADRGSFERLVGDAKTPLFATSVNDKSDAHGNRTVLSELIAPSASDTLSSKESALVERVQIVTTLYRSKKGPQGRRPDAEAIASVLTWLSGKPNVRFAVTANLYFPLRTHSSVVSLPAPLPSGPIFGFTEVSGIRLTKRENDATGGPVLWDVTIRPTEYYWSAQVEFGEDFTTPHGFLSSAVANALEIGRLAVHRNTPTTADEHTAR